MLTEWLAYLQLINYFPNPLPNNISLLYETAQCKNHSSVHSILRFFPVMEGMCSRAFLFILIVYESLGVKRWYENGPWKWAASWWKKWWVHKSFVHLDLHGKFSHSKMTAYSETQLTRTVPNPLITKRYVLALQASDWTESG